jgi:muconate cycloisomerase
VLKRIDVTSRTLVTLVEPGSCFVERRMTLYDAVKMAASGDAAGIGLYGGTMLEGGSARRRQRRLSACCRSWPGAPNCSVRSCSPRRCCSTPLHYSDFGLQVPTGPGIGVDLDMDRVAFFRRDGGSPRAHSLASR